jgi:hypothetical protein
VIDQDYLFTVEVETPHGAAESIRCLQPEAIGRHLA